MIASNHTIVLLNACNVRYWELIVYVKNYAVLDLDMYFHVFNQADMIYVNYGRAEDFEYLLKHNASCRGKIVIVRYGGNFRGDKVNRSACCLLSTQSKIMSPGPVVRSPLSLNSGVVKNVKQVYVLMVQLK